MRFNHFPTLIIFITFLAHYFAANLQMFLHKLPCKVMLLSFRIFFLIPLWKETFPLKPTATITKFIPPHVAGLWITLSGNQTVNNTAPEILTNHFLPGSSNLTFYSVPSINHLVKSLNFAFSYCSTAFIANLLATAYWNLLWLSMPTIMSWHSPQWTRFQVFGKGLKTIITGQIMSFG